MWYTIPMSRRAFTLTETLIIGALFGIFVLGGTLVLGAERARTRDARRIADMTRLAAGFALLYSQKASYTDAAAGCAAVNTDASTCTLQDVVGPLNAIRDPGKFSYTVVRVPDREDYAIRFQLERAYGTLKAGAHLLTKSGIR